MSAELRTATIEDLDAIMRLEDAVFPPDAWSRESMAGELSSPHTHYLVAVDPASPEELLGYAGLAAPIGGPQGDIQTIAVAEGARRQGLGRRIMHALIAEATRRGVTELFLEVRADNPSAQALYEQLGFERIAVRPRYYRGGIDAVIMRLGLPAAGVGS